MLLSKLDNYFYKWQFRYIFIFLFIYLAFTLLPDGLETVFNFYYGRTVNLFTSTDELLNFLGYSDVTSYASCGKLWSLKGSLNIDGCKLLWPPGMFFIYKINYDLFLNDGYPVLTFTILTVLIWTFLISWIFVSIRQPKFSFSIFFTLILLIQLPFVKSGIFGNLLMSEPISIGLFSLSTLFLYESLYKNKMINIFFASIFFSLSCYFRSQYFLIFEVYLCFSIFFVFVYFFVIKFNFLNARKKLFLLSLVIKNILLTCLITFLFCLPYLIYNKINYDKFSWSNVNYYFLYSWMTDDEFTPIQSFVKDGGGNIPCKIDPEKCEFFKNKRLNDERVSFSDYRSAIYLTFIKNPISYTSLKLSYLPKFWFAHGQLSSYLLIANLLFLFLASIYSLFSNTGSGLKFLFIIFMLNFIAKYVIFIFFHYEVRYFYPFNFLSIFISILVFKELFVFRKN